MNRRCPLPCYALLPLAALTQPVLSAPDQLPARAAVHPASPRVAAHPAPAGAVAHQQPAQPEASYGAVALDVAHAWMDNTPPDAMAWNWDDAVAGLGLQAVYDATGDTSILLYLQDWIDYYLARGVYINRSDAVVPCTSALYLYARLGDPAYLELVGECEDYVQNVAPRLDDGAITHGSAFPNQIWVDSLFMLGTFLTMDGQYHDAAWATDEIADQFGLFRPHLRSDEFQLYWHMYEEAIDRHVPASPTFWGRGNGWVLSSLAILLSALPADHPDRASLEAAFIDHASAVMYWQDPGGLWWTVVNRPGDSYLETSATALFTFSLLRGYHLGLLGEDARDAGLLGLSGLLTRIEYDAAGTPVVTGTSGSTSPGPFVYYANIPVYDDEPYGVGAVLMALEEGALEEGALEQ